VISHLQKTSALAASHFYSSQHATLNQRAADAMFLEISEASEEILFFVDEIQEGDFEQLFIFRRPNFNSDYGGQAFVVVKMKRVKEVYFLTQYNDNRNGGEFMSFDPSHLGDENKKAWREIFFSNFIWWLETYNLYGFKRNRIMHFSKQSLGSRTPNGIMTVHDYSYQ
jgi:hypothetical protein